MLSLIGYIEMYDFITSPVTLKKDYFQHHTFPGHFHVSAQVDYRMLVVTDIFEQKDPNDLLCDYCRTSFIMALPTSLTRQNKRSVY